MSMRPCLHEQDVLFYVHGASSPFQRLRVTFHLLSCESCRQRREDYELTTRALNALRPGFATPSLAAGAPPRRRTRLILCSAAVAIAAAALSYHFAFGDTEPRAELESEPIAAGALPFTEPCAGGPMGAAIPDAKRAQMAKAPLKKSEAALNPAK